MRRAKTAAAYDRQVLRRWSQVLRDRQIVLAGGSGGLGSATAELLEGEGARLFVSYRSNADRARRWNGIHADLTSAEDRHRLLDAAPRIYGLAVFTGDPARLSPDLSPGASLEEALRRSHEINFLGPILLAREAAERMKALGTPGAIVLISSMQARMVFAGSTAYGAQKAALEHAAMILAKECRGPVNIRVNVVSPGVIDAGMAQASIASGKYDRFLKDGVVHRFGRAEDIARTIRFLLEPDNYITGQVLGVDGGAGLGV